jgi:hypothetical protein
MDQALKRDQSGRPLESIDMLRGVGTQLDEFEELKTVKKVPFWNSDYRLKCSGERPLNEKTLREQGLSLIVIELTSSAKV